MLRLALVNRGLRRLSSALLLLSVTCSLSFAQDFRWHNAENPHDVNADQSVWADDVMPVVNCLNGVSAYCIGGPEGGFVFSSALSPPPFLDAMPSDYPSPIDALIVINTIDLTLPRIPPANPITTAQEGFKVRLATTDVIGNPLETVDVGKAFLLQAYVSDDRPNAQGVFSAYLDVAYPSVLVEPAGAVDFGLDYPHGQAGDTDTAGLLDNYGGITLSLTPPGSSTERLLFSMPMRGVAGGDVTFALQEAASYGLLFGIDPFVTTDPTTAQIRVVPEPTSFFLLIAGFCGIAIRRRRVRWITQGC